MTSSLLLVLMFYSLPLLRGETNYPPIFRQINNNLVLSESTPVGTVIYQLEGSDPEGSQITFGSIGSEHFEIDPISGNITLIKSLDREKTDSLKFLITIRDRVSPYGESELDNIVHETVTVIITDENDNAPEFLNTPYGVDIREDAEIGTIVFDGIQVKDADIVGESLELTCLSSSPNSDSCQKFRIEVVTRDPTVLSAMIVLNDSLDYNQISIYHFVLQASDGLHTSETNFEVRILDVQNKPPVFFDYKSNIIDEDSPINTLVLKIQARDGDTGKPRKIVYDLLTNPMDYFVLDEYSGDLRTAKQLDRENLADSAGIIKVLVRAREIVNGMPSNNPLESTTSQVTITIRDVNDNAPIFNRKEFEVSLPENTAIGTPLTLDMNVTDHDMGINSKFSLRLEDISNVFQVEPTMVTGFSQVYIRVTNGSLDYENPNHRKFIVLVIAEETDTNPKLSSTAIIIVTVLDINDNKPNFEKESYSANVPEDAIPGHYIIAITATDLDSGNFGEEGLRYSLTGNGAELFHVNEKTGIVTLADCSTNKHKQRSILPDHLNFNRFKRQYFLNLFNNTQNENISNELHSYFMKAMSGETQTNSNVEYELIQTSDNEDKVRDKSPPTCLDYETEPTYFLTYKATDDEGRGQSSVVSLRISVTDTNDSPPICESPHYRASIDEGSNFFDSTLMVKAHDADITSTIKYSIVGDKLIQDTFEIDQYTGEITVRPNVKLDITPLKTNYLEFSVKASDGTYSTNCYINVTIRDVNDHEPYFLSTSYLANVEENSEIGTSVQKLQATDMDSGINAQLKYRIEQGSFDDFRIDETTGEVFVSRKLDYDRRNTYRIEVIAMDKGTPSLSGTSTLTVNIINSNDKDPYFTPVTQNIEVRENAPVGTVLYTLIALDPDVGNRDALEFAAVDLTAIDKDGNEVIYNEHFKEYFTITRSGQVIVNKPLDRNLFAILRLNVLVTDSTAPNVQQGRGLLIIQIVDVNKTAPKFNSPWTIENPVIKLQMIEEQPIGTVLTILQAYDEESSIGEYDISTNEYFQINKTSGIIILIKRLDYETVKEVKLIAFATDTGVPALTTTADLLVDVINLNDNVPYFNQNEYYFNVTENSLVSTTIGRIEAFDNDLGTFGEISYYLIGENNKYFSIDAYTGNIMVTNSSILDREQVKEITLTAVAKDKAPATVQKSATVPIRLNIIDINDNVPQFTQNEYTSTVAENAAMEPPAALLQVNAIDLDEGLFGDVRYAITDGNDKGLFKLDSETGIIYPAQNLSGHKGIYKLTVTARDSQGSGIMEATAKVIITVMEVNQYRPKFVIPTLSNATIEIPLNIVPENYLLLTVKAIDNDTDANGKVTYYLQVNNQNVNETNEFHIGRHTGELRTKKELNREDKSNFDIILVARDDGNPKPFETLRFLNIHIVDANENRVEFSETNNPYKISVVENIAHDIKIGSIQATSGNRYTKKNIYYYLLLGNEEGAFEVDKNSGDIFTNKSLDREITDTYTLYILGSIKPDLHISDNERSTYSIKTLERDHTVAKVIINILDVNDNPPIFGRNIYYAGVNAKATVGSLIAIVNATDADIGKNANIEYAILASNLYKFGTSKSTGSIVPSPFRIMSDGRIITDAHMSEYNQDRFELEVLAKEIEIPYSTARTKVILWIFDHTQLVRIILSRPPEEVYEEQDEIIAELHNATELRIIVDEIRYHVDAMGRIHMDWCDLFFHAVHNHNMQIASVDEILEVIDANYDYLREYYAGFAIENILPAFITVIRDEFDLAVAGLVALIIVLFVGIVSFIVLCCCLKHWNLSVPTENRRKEALIKKQIIEDLNTTENPLWMEQKLKLYEEQELTMQVFSEPDHISSTEMSENMERRNSVERIHHTMDNTYATIQPRNGGNNHNLNSNSRNLDPGGRRIEQQLGDFADYATLNNSHPRPPSMYEFTGSTFQAPIRDGDDVATELI